MKPMDDDYSEYIISDVTEPLADTLAAHVDDGFVSSVEIQITGYVEGDAIIEFENGAGRFEKVLLADSVEYLYKTEWYDNNLAFAYTPTCEVAKGDITLRYKFR